MARFSELEDGLTTSATRTDARAQAAGVDHSSVIEATFLLDRVRRISFTLRRVRGRRVAPRAAPKSDARANRPNRVEVPLFPFENELRSPRLAFGPRTSVSRARRLEKADLRES
jgi:hypothetical protein